MDRSVDCSVIVLTHNEEVNIIYLLESVQWAREVFIVDSGSTDKTVEIAEKYGARVYQHAWKTYADQLNWALENLPFTTEWLMRMDADEYVMTELADEIKNKLSQLPADVTGCYVKRRVYFMGRWIRHGSYYPTWLLRIFRRGHGRCESLWMDEHIVLSDGISVKFEHDIVDQNHKGLSFWTVKHEKYAEREMLDLMVEEETALTANDENQLKPSLFGEQDKRKRWLKTNLYAQSPLFLRAIAYFLYRFIFRLGFLDGKEGLIFHVLQGFWYRFYVDAKIWEKRYNRRLKS